MIVKATLRDDLPEYQSGKKDILPFHYSGRKRLGQSSMQLKKRTWHFSNVNLMHLCRDQFSGWMQVRDLKGLPKL